MTDTAAPPQPGALLRWPPPGLERLQGDLGRIAARAALAGGLLVCPMLFVVAREQGFATLGPLADAWWVTIVLTSVGLAFAIEALLRSARLLRRSGRAVNEGYDLATIWRVAVDSANDMGFLLQGARHFAMMDERERSAMVRIRVAAMTLHALAGVWLSLALGVGLLASARGLVTPAGLWMSTLLPGGVAYVFGGVLRLVHDARIRAARRSYYDQAWSRDLVSDEIEQWRRDRSSLSSGAMATDGGRRWAGAGRALSTLAVVVAVSGIVVALPVLTLLPTSVAGPVLSSLATPRFDRVRQQAAQAEGYRPYVVPVDSSLSPREAGELLHELAYVGLDDEPSAGERQPRRRVTQPWLPEVGDPNPLALDPFVWGDSLMDLVSRGTTGAQRAYLAQVAAHPSSIDFSRLATAPDLDAAAARWVSPFPSEITIATMPIPRFNGLRQGAQAHLGAAAYALAMGDQARAERRVSEVISVGFLLGDYGPTLIDNLIGFTLVGMAGRALEDLYRVTGQDGALAELERLTETADRAASRVRIVVPQGTETWVRSLPDMVLDSTVVRGLRWEYFIGVTTLTPCLNLHRMVFGPDDDYRRFLTAAREALVRHPSEAGLFELASAGWLGAMQASEPTLLGRILSVSMNRGESTCGAVVRRLQSAQAIF